MDFFNVEVIIAKKLNEVELENLNGGNVNYVYDYDEPVDRRQYELISGHKDQESLNYSKELKNLFTDIVMKQYYLDINKIKTDFNIPDNYSIVKIAYTNDGTEYTFADTNSPSTSFFGSSEITVTIQDYKYKEEEDCSICAFRTLSITHPYNDECANELLNNIECNSQGYWVIDFELVKKLRNETKLFLPPEFANIEKLPEDYYALVHIKQ